MEFITNRTLGDVERWKTLRDKGWSAMTDTEKSEWLDEISITPSAARGMYTHVDLNRVETAVEVLASRLRELGYIPSISSVKTDWTYKDAFWAVDAERYVSNVAALRKASIVFPNTPDAPGVGKKLDYSLANDIEKILEDIERVCDSIPKTWCHSGEVFMGEI